MGSQILKPGLRDHFSIERLQELQCSVTNVTKGHEKTLKWIDLCGGFE